MNINFTKYLLALALGTMLFCSNNSMGQNLLNLNEWIIGDGSTTSFSQNGLNSENIREWGIGPFGNRTVLWKSIPNGDAHADGGWDSTPFSVDHRNMYRYVVWIKKLNSNDGTTYFGCNNVVDLLGNYDNNPYFWYGNLPELNKWYLLVGYVHGSGDHSLENYGGIYDGISGAKVISITDFKFDVNATYSFIRSYLFYDPNINNQQYFYSPRVDVVNGSEPSIKSLLEGEKGDLSYFPGNVGIGTTTPTEKLSVNGKIRAKEIKVEATNWPDYVFNKNYNLTSLENIESFIIDNKHLPDIPSAKEVEEKGISLGKMNALLLKKIEELTLHLIEKDKQVKFLKKEMGLIHLKLNTIENNLKK